MHKLLPFLLRFNRLACYNNAEKLSDLSWDNYLHKGQHSRSPTLIFKMALGMKLKRG